MEAHYTYFDSFGLHNPDVQKFITALTIGCGLILAGKFASSRISARLTSGNTAEAVIPDEKLSIPAIFDVIIEALVNFQDSILGRENRKYFPLVGTVFFFTLACNLLGLIPGIPAVTTTVWITVALALVIFFSFNSYGIKENGLFGYLKHFAGPIVFMSPLIFPIEVFGTILRILTLNLRLYWNITADHIVLSIFTDLVPPVLPVVFYGLGTFVCVMQAFIPTVLTIIYIQLATQHGDHDEHH